jgi:hypothetical protein
MRASEGARVSVSGRWTRLKRSEPEMATAVRPFVKEKWDDATYFKAQVRAAERVARSTHSVW